MEPLQAMKTDTNSAEKFIVRMKTTYCGYDFRDLDIVIANNDIYKNGDTVTAYDSDDTLHVYDEFVSLIITDKNNNCYIFREVPVGLIEYGFIIALYSIGLEKSYKPIEPVEIHSVPKDFFDNRRVKYIIETTGIYMS